MKQLFACLTILFVFAFPNRALAYKAQTHRRLSLESVNASVLRTDFAMLGRLGLEPLSTGQPFPNYKGEPKSISDLVQDGAAFEDVPGPRVRHHFYNPRTGRPAHSCGLNQTTRHWHTQAASCEITCGAEWAARSASTAAVTSGV